MQFTREAAENGKLPCLDCPVSRDDNSLQTTVYRKPHKATTIRTLTRRAQLVCNTTDSLSDVQVPWPCFSRNNYNEDFMQRNTHRPSTTSEANDNTSRTTTATTLYIKGISENISRILQPFNIRVAHKPITTLRQLLTWTSKTKTNRGTDREQCIRLIAPTATPPTLVRLAETSQLDWLNTNERRGKAMSPITLLNVTDLRTTLFTGTLRNA